MSWARGEGCNEGSGLSVAPSEPSAASTRLETDTCLTLLPHRSGRGCSHWRFEDGPPLLLLVKREGAELALLSFIVML